MSTETADAPLRVRVQFGHAAVQVVADERRIDVLHIKGVAIDRSLTDGTRSGADADILVRPSQARALVAALRSRGWQPYSGFETGSPFGHAETLCHPQWGYVDVHRFFPGTTVPPGAAFDRLWRDRAERHLAAVACAVPSLDAQVALLVLNAARPGGHGPRDLATAWEPATPERRAAVLRLVDELGATVAFAAATGDLERHRGARDYDLWKVVTQGGTRLEEWRARIKAAPTRRDALRVALRAPLVNTDQLAHRLGRRPTPVDVVRESVSRGRRGATEAAGALRARRQGRRS